MNNTKRKSRLRDFSFWLGNRDSNPNKQSQSLSCCRYTIPQCARTDIIIALFYRLSRVFLYFVNKIYFYTKSAASKSSVAKTASEDAAATTTRLRLKYASRTATAKPATADSIKPVA